MIKARSGDNLILGLSARNVELLMAGKPIVVDMRDVGFPGGQVTLMYGATEAAITEELRTVFLGIHS